MTVILRRATCWFVLCAALGAADTVSQAAPIIYLNVGGSAAIDIQYSGGVLSTPASQNTPVEFVNFLDWKADIPTAAATFALSGVTQTGLATILPGGMIMQSMDGGNFTLHDETNTLLLSADLGPSVLGGTAGLPNDGLFTSHFDSSMVTGGTLAQHLIADSVVLQMHLFNINGGAGMSVNVTSPPFGGILQAFTTDATVDIEAEQIPEPATFVAALLAALAVLATQRRMRHF